MNQNTERGVAGGDDDDVTELDLTQLGKDDEDGADADRGDTLHPEVTDEGLRELAAEVDAAGGKGAAAGVAAATGTEEDEDGEAGQAGGTGFVPKGRLNQVLQQRDTEREARIRAEERASMLERQLGSKAGAVAGAAAEGDAAPATAFDYGAKEREYAEALMGGDTDKAVSIRAEINAELKREAKTEASAEAQSTLTAARQHSDLNATVAAVITDYPFLDSNSDDKNEEAIKEVVEFRNLYMGQGKAPAEALRMAADRVGRYYKPADTAGAATNDAAGAGKAATTAGSTKPPPTRQQEVMARNARTQQPPPLGGVGSGNRAATAEALDVSKMSEEEFERLPESEKAKLRGD